MGGGLRGRGTLSPAGTWAHASHGHVHTHLHGLSLSIFHHEYGCIHTNSFLHNRPWKDHDGGYTLMVVGRT